MGDFIMSGISFSTDALAGTPTAGTTEYNGTALYFTPTSTQRGVIPGQQMFALNTSVVGLNATGNQSVFGVGVTLASSTTYAFESNFTIIKTAGSAPHFLNFGFGGTATTNWINYNLISSFNNGTWGSLNATGSSSPYTGIINNTTAMTAMTASTTTVTVILNPLVKGMIYITSGGTFIPQYSLSAAPGGAYTTQAGSYFLIYPVSSGSSNVSIGTWA